jgi:hypothetical protein
MLDAWGQVQDSIRTTDFGTILLRILLAVFVGFVVATAYRFSHGNEKRSENAVMFATLVLLCVFISMVSMVIGNSVAMAFSLVGALSIVRFRTVVEDTRDTAFVIFAVISGMAMGAGYFAVPAVGVPIASAVAIALHRWDPGKSDRERYDDWMLLTIRIGIGRDMSMVLEEMLESYIETKQLLSTSTLKQGSAIEIVYRVQLKKGVDPLAMVSFTNLIDGIQAVEVKSLLQGIEKS